MGISCSCPFADYTDLESGFESIIVKSVNFGDGEERTTTRSVSFNGRDSEPTIMKSLDSGKMVVERSISFKRGETGTVISIQVPPSDNKANCKMSEKIDNQCLISDKSSDSGESKHKAALKLQKVYKSFRTRRKLADCAILVQQSWWELLDFAELKRSSVSFFDTEKHETATSRWLRARTRAAKVGKGLSKDGKARKLALQHWLEAIDPRHRYGHNLQFYFIKWLQSQSREPFFYWLDIGEGKEVNLIEKCPRAKLHQQCIKYLGPMERKAYEVVVEEGKFLYKQTGEFLNTVGESKWIFVLSTSKNLYVGKKNKGTFQHSSFLAGGATSAAGRLIVENGNLKAVWPHSGHYRPTEENFQEFILFLEENNVDLTNVRMSPVDGEEGSLRKQRYSFVLRSSLSEEDLTKDEKEMEVEEEEAINGENLIQNETNESFLEPPSSKQLQSCSRKLKNLQIPTREDFYGSLEMGNADSDEEKEIIDVEESVLQRMNSHKEAQSYQLGKHLSFKWTTGAGPRIGCVRDYPSQLQARALQQVNLSPKSESHSSDSYFSPTVENKNLSRRSSKHLGILSSPLCRGKSASDTELVS